MMRLLLALILIAAAPAYARDAAFVEPGKGGGGQQAKDAPAEVLYATPNDTDVGETIIGITKRLTLFFNNSGTRPAKISEFTMSADSNVRTEIVDNDCAKIEAIASGERCSIGVQVTPNSPGPWSAEVLAVHDAPGRVTRAAIMGTTAGEVGNSGQQPGLSLMGASKDQQIDFGNVEVGLGRAVRTVLLINDSPNPLKIESIDLVGADRGLSLSKDGCKPEMEIAAGSSCPITAMWQPLGRGDVSTDLIIRHTGPVGFAVIPVRGVTSGGGSGSAIASSTTSSSSNSMTTSQETAAANLPTGKIPSISSAALFAQASGSGANSKLVLRGTVGQRAILADSNGTVTVATVGQVITAEGIEHKIVAVEPNRVLVNVEGANTELTMGSGVNTNNGGSNGGSMKSMGSKNSASGPAATAIPPVSGASLTGGT